MNPGVMLHYYFVSCHSLLSTNSRSTPTFTKRQTQDNTDKHDCVSVKSKSSPWRVDQRRCVRRMYTVGLSSWIFLYSCFTLINKQPCNSPNDETGLDWIHVSWKMWKLDGWLLDSDSLSTATANTNLGSIEECYKSDTVVLHAVCHLVFLFFFSGTMRIWWS